MLRSSNRILCMCVDNGCEHCGGNCQSHAETTLYRMDMDDATGVDFCEGCAVDAMQSGLFTDEEPCEEEEDDEPSEGDYVIGPSGPLGGRISVSNGNFLAEFIEQSDAEQFIREHMQKEQFFPNVWYCSDHGNYHHVSL